MPYLGDILPEDPDSTFDPDSDIKEIIGDDQPGGGDAFGVDAPSEGALVYLIDWKKARSFLRFMLGFSYADSGSPYKLHRENPQVHPRFPWMTAATVSFSSFAPKVSADSVPANTPNFPAVFTGTDDAKLTKTAHYAKCYATVRFVDRPWVFRPDSYVTTYADEFERNVYPDLSPSVEMISAEGPLGQMKWSETGTDGPTVGQPIPTPFGTLVPKCTFTLNWMWVPEEYLSDNAFIFYPEKILERIGRVNSATFGDWDTATILLMPPKFQRFRWPVSTFDGIYPFFGWNISMPCVHFQPRPRGATSPSDDGYRLLPWPFNLKWFAAKRADNATYLFQESDMNKLFQHVGDGS